MNINLSSIYDPSISIMATETVALRLTNDVQFKVPGFVITCRFLDGYINATEMCRAAGKLIGHWNENKRTDSFLTDLSEDVGISVTKLVKIEKHGMGNITWVHPRVALEIAHWMSTKFAVKVAGWVHQLMAVGHVEYGKEMSSDEVMKEQMKQMKSTINALEVKADKLEISNKKLQEKNMRLTSSLQKLFNEMDSNIEAMAETKNKLKILCDDYAHASMYMVPSQMSRRIYETVTLYRVTDIESRAYICHYLMCVQKKSFVSTINKRTLAHQNRDFDLKYMCEVVPNATMIRHALKTRLTPYTPIGGHHIMNKNTITLNDNIDEDRLIDIIVAIIDQESFRVDSSIENAFVDESRMIA